MSFKSFFLTEENDGATTKVAPETKTAPVSFPQQVSSFPQTAPSTPQTVNVQQTTSFPQVAPAPVNTGSNRFLNDIMDVYDKNFNKLNQPGYDFFEFFKAVNKAGVDNPQVYGMALDMAQAMDASVSKDTLSSQADYYVAELEKIHSTINGDGTKKGNDLLENKKTETQSLSSEISNIQQQIEILTTQLNEKQKSLNEIDVKYNQPIADISEKLSANDIAKNILIGNITKVKQNILINLK